MHKWIIVMVVVMVCMALSGVARADQEAPSYPYVTASSNGRYYFKMLPNPVKPYDHDQGTGAAYRVRTGECDELLWSVSGWYAFSTFLSNDGLYLIRIGNWPRGRQPSEEHLAIAFYKSGELLQAYSTSELIMDYTKVSRSVSHYRFLREPPDFLTPGATQFKLVTIDDVEYRFDITTGAILSKTTVTVE